MMERNNGRKGVPVDEPTAADWIEWAADVVEANLHETDPTLLQVMLLTEHGHFPGHEGDE